MEQKLAMLRDAFGPGGSVRAAIERHEVTSGLLYTWRRQAMSGELAKEKRYGIKLWTALTRFLAEGRLEIDNGIAERALRGVAVGRRNWLFVGSRKGGERAVSLYTVIQTAKANGLEPQAHIADVLGRLAGGWPAARWDDLMPWKWSSAPTPLARAA